MVNLGILKLQTVLTHQCYDDPWGVECGGCMVLKIDDHRYGCRCELIVTPSSIVAIGTTIWNMRW